MDKNNKKLFIALVVSVVVIFLMWVLDPLLDIFPHLDDKGPAWYYWKLPNATLWGTVTAWGGYILHQLFAFIFIIKSKKKKISSFNNKFLFGNLFFVFLHILQTHLFYDGTAQQVPVWSSQYSVILMLSITLILLMPKRGFVLGRFKNISKEVFGFFKKYHGLYISWAIVYTFWFHPTEGDIAILIGFFYMFLLFIHMSMVKTKVHMNIKWITVLETFVLFHGVGIALMNGQEIWPMFFTGFFFMFVFTYMYGLGFPKSVRILFHLIYIGSVIVLYYYRGYNKIYEITFIPVTLYGISLLMMGIKKATLLLKK